MIVIKIMITMIFNMIALSQPFTTQSLLSERDGEGTETGTGRRGDAESISDSLQRERESARASVPLSVAVCLSRSDSLSLSLHLSLSPSLHLSLSNFLSLARSFSSHLISSHLPPPSLSFSRSLARSLIRLLSLSPCLFPSFSFPLLSFSFSCSHFLNVPFALLHSLSLSRCIKSCLLPSRLSWDIN